MYVCTHIHMYICIHVCMYICIYVYTHIYIYNMCVYVYIYICIYVYMYLYIMCARGLGASSTIRTRNGTERLPSRPPRPTCRLMGRTSAQLDASWTPLGRNLPFQAALQAQLGASWAQLGPPSRTPSATWRFLGRFLVLLQPSESSSRLDESSILMVQAFLQSKRSWTAVSQLCNGSRTPFGLNLEALGSLLGRSWSLFGRSWPLLARSWPLLGGSWGAPRRPWEALGRLLGASWANLGSKWPPSGLQVSSKWAPSGPQVLQVTSKCTASALPVASK